MKCLLSSESGKCLLLQHVAGRLQGAQKASVLAHVRGCDVCREHVAEQSRVWDFLDEWEPQPVSLGFNRELYARVERESRIPLWRTLGDILNGWVARPTLPLAAFTLLIIAGVYLERPQAPSAALPVAAEAPAVVTPTDAEQLDKALDDLQLLHQLDLVKDEAAEASHGM